LLQYLKNGGQRAAVRLIDKQVDMFGHQDVARDDEFIANARGFQLRFENAVCSRTDKEGKTVITAEGDEVEGSGVMKPNKAPWHGGGILPRILARVL
jgi:hypothetical protein